MNGKLVYACVRMLPSLLLGALASGCARNRIYFTSASTTRPLTVEEVRSPEKIKFRAFKCDSRTNTIVVAKDLVGKWRLSKSYVWRLIDHLGLSEERKVSDSVKDYVFQDDGTFVQVSGNKKWVGVWFLEDGVLTLDYRPSDKLVERLAARWINHDEIWVRTPDEDLNVAGYGNTFANWEKNVPTGGYDEDGSYRVSCVFTERGNPANKFTDLYDQSPLILRRLSHLKCNDVERKKNLDSLLKAGVITEEEYKKELGKETK